MEDLNNQKTEFEKQIELQSLKTKRSFRLKLIIVGVIFLMVITYLFTPLSKVRTPHLKGNLNLNENQILEICHLKESSSLFLIDAKKCEKLLDDHPFIANSKVKVNLSGVYIEMEEETPVLKYGNDYYLNSGSLLDKKYLSDPLTQDYLVEITKSVPEIISKNDSFTKESINRFTSFYFALNQENRNKIAYVSFTQDDLNQIALIYQGEDFYRRIQLEIQGQIKSYQDMAKIFEDDNLTMLENQFFKNKDKLPLMELKTFEKDRLSFKYRSIKVIINYSEFNDHGPIRSASVYNEPLI